MEDQNKKFNYYLNQLESFYDSLNFIVGESSNLEVSEYKNLLNQFYEDGWDATFGDGDSFYVLEGNYVKAIDAARELGREEELKTILEKIWQILPEFYEIHQKLGDSVPQIPEKWF